MITVYFVRHAPAIRPKGLVYGKSDFPADTSDGVSIRALAAKLPTSCRWVSSSLLRARQTGQSVASYMQYGNAIEVDAHFDEQNFGELEGKPRPSSALSSFWLFDREFRPAEGESFNDLSNRVRTGLNGLLQVVEGSAEVVVFTHGNVMRAAIAASLGLEGDSPSRISIANWACVGLKWSERASSVFVP